MRISLKTRITAPLSQFEGFSSDFFLGKKVIVRNFILPFRIFIETDNRIDIDCKCASEPLNITDEHSRHIGDVASD